MKKLSLIALAAMTLLPSTMMATERTDTVRTKSEFTAAITAANTAKAGDVHKIVCAWDASEVLSLSTVKPEMTAGKLIITSDETEYDKMPQMMVGFDWAADLADDGNFALVFENVGLQYRTGKEATSGQIVYFNKRDAQMDSLIFRNCDISNYPRTLYRAVPKDLAEDGSNAETRIKNIGKLEMSGCRVHDCNTKSGNNWACIYPGQAVNEVIIKNNMFYDMPYCQAIFQMGYASEGTGTTPTFTFENNTVLQAKAELINGAESVNVNRFQVVNVGSYFSLGATFNINNNIFLSPQVGTYSDILKNDTTDFVGNGVILNANSAIVYANNNVVDPLAFSPIGENSPSQESGNYWLFDDIKNSYTPEQAGITSWESGAAFQDAEKSLYYMQKSSPAYTMGVGGTYLGAEDMYVDEFPTKANINITIDGPKYITYTVSPEKTQYYVGDEVIITLNDHNSSYRTFNSFEGWSDGNMDITRTITLEGDLNLTAKYLNDDEVVAAFDFSTITSNNNALEYYDADIYFDMNPAYQARVSAIVCDIENGTGNSYPYINGAFQGRPSKFAENDEDQRMAVISRRTDATAKEVQRDYALISLSTKGVSDINVSAYVGTDNNAAKTQILEWSSDSTTWNRVATVDLTEGYKWEELNGNLPAEANDKDKIYLRIISDPASGHVVDGIGCTEDTYAGAAAFEYIGNILISGNTSGAETGIVSVSNESKTFDANAPIYNMMGMKVAKGTKGLLIQNGKKFIVK